MSDKIKLNEEEIFKLIELRGEKFDGRFTGKKFDNNAGWKAITSALGYKEDFYKAIKKKWENLIQKYKKLKRPQSGLSTEDGPDLPINWPYYTAIDRIMAEKHVISPVKLISSIEFPGSSCCSKYSGHSSNSSNFDKLSCGSKSENVNSDADSCSPQVPTSDEYFENGGKKLTPAKRKHNNEILEYLQKRDKKILNQNKTLIKIMKKKMEMDGVAISDVSSESD